MKPIFIRTQPWIYLALANALFQPTAHAATDSWQLADVTPFYLQSPPNSLTGLYRSQGIATDGNQWFFSWQYGLERADNNYNSIQRNSSVTLPATLAPGIPASLLAQGLNHIGDIDYYNGVIYASLDTTNGYNNGHVALYKASDLSYTGVSYALTGAPSNPHTDVASWVAVDPTRDVGYGKEWQNGNTLNVYNLNDWSFSHTITLDQSLVDIQGAKVSGDWLYLSSNNATESVYRANLLTGHVEELFQLPTTPGNHEVEGIALRNTAAGGVDLYVEMIVDPNKALPNYTDTQANLSLYHYTEVAAVPVPPALWLFSSALLAVGAFGKRRRFKPAV